MILEAVFFLPLILWLCYHLKNMHRLLIGIYFVCLLATGYYPEGQADEIRLTNGDILKGQPASYGEEGLIVKLDIGVFSQRVHWIKVTQESLKQLAQNPKIAPFAEPFVELPMDTSAAKKSKEIRIKPVPRIDRITEKTSLLGSLTTAPGLVMLGLLFIGNLFAAYEIGVYRGRPVALVCGVSAVLPVIGPILFLATPSATPVMVESMDDGATGASNEPVNPMASTGSRSGGLSVASQEKGGGGGDAGATKVFKKGDTTFNRRWFEVTFSGFFRVVPSEAEKNLVLVVKAGRNEYVAKRITRISMTDIHLQLINAGEIPVSFDEIYEVQVRHKDAKV